MIFQPHLLPQFAQYKSVNKKFKLNLCKDYEIAKKCPMDIRCHYAHGKHELRKFDDVIFTKKFSYFYYEFKLILLGTAFLVASWLVSDSSGGYWPE